MRTAIQIGRVVLLLSAAMLAVTTAAGCARDASAKATHETPAVIKPQEITINSKNYFFVAPDTIEAGLTTIHLRNAGPALHHAQIIKLRRGRRWMIWSTRESRRAKRRLRRSDSSAGPTRRRPVARRRSPS